MVTERTASKRSPGASLSPGCCVGSCWILIGLAASHNVVRTPDVCKTFVGPERRIMIVLPLYTLWHLYSKSCQLFWYWRSWWQFFCRYGGMQNRPAFTCGS